MSEPSAADRELIEGLFEAFNARDEAWVELFDEDAELHPTGAGAAGVYRGRDGLRSYLADLWDTWEEINAELRGLSRIGELLLVEYLTSGRGRGSGLEVEQEFFLLLKVRDGRVREWRNFESRAEAERAAGAADGPA
jgi:ketosteroid isomerase-like protein